MRRSIVFAAIVAAASLAAPQTASAQLCTAATTMTTFTGYVSCAGSFAGNLTGDAADLAQVNSLFGSGFTYAGKSDDAGSGPFVSNPGSTSGTLTFDSPLIGNVVIGLKAGPRYSLYAYNFTSPTSSVPFNTIGTSIGNETANALSHAALYRRPSTVVPEPSTYALMAAGLAGLGLVARRRRA